MNEKFKSVGEMMSYFTKEEMIQERFVEKLMSAYPQLFPKDADGQPREPDCGVWCPVGWQPMVEELCDHINYYLENNNTWIEKYVAYYAVCSRIYKFLRIGRIMQYLSKTIDPVVYPQGGCILASKVDEIRKASPFRTWLTRQVWRLDSFLRPTKRFVKKLIPPVTITQIKSKFGTLRFYYDGGDKQINGMVSFAERISGTICEVTGTKGKLCIHRGWYKTLCEEKMKDLGYMECGKNDQ